MILSIDRTFAGPILVLTDMGHDYSLNKEKKCWT